MVDRTVRTTGNSVGKPMRGKAESHSRRPIDTQDTLADQSPPRSSLHGGVRENKMGHGGPKRARSWKRRIEPRKAYSSWRSSLLGGSHSISHADFPVLTDICGLPTTREVNFSSEVYIGVKELLQENRLLAVNPVSYSQRKVNTGSMRVARRAGI